MIEKFVDWCMRFRYALLGAIVLITVVLGVFATRVEVKTIFSDLPNDFRAGRAHCRRKQEFGRQYQSCW